MPRVQSYQTDTINQRPTADTSTNVRSSPDDFGASVGKATRQLGGTLADLGTQLQLRENETWAREQETLFQKTITERLSDNNTSFYSKTGKAAYDGLDAEREYTDKLAESMLEQADNEAKRKRLGDLLNNKKSSLYDSYGRHALKGLKAWENSQNQFAAKTAIESAAANPYSRDVITHLERGRMEISDMYYRNGASEEEVKARVDAYENDFHKAMISTLIEDNPSQAKAYFNVNKDDLLADTRNAISKQLESANLLQQAQQQADLIMEKATLEQSDPIKLAKLIEDPELRKETESLVRVYDADRKRRDKEVQDNIINSAWQGVIDNPRPESIPKTMRYDHRIKMMKYIETIASGKNIETSWPTYYELSKMAGDPERRNEFQGVNLNEYRTELADSEFKELVKIQTGLKSNDQKTKLKLDEIYSNTQVLNQRLENVNIKTNPKEGTDEAKRLTKFQQYVDQQVSEFKQTNGGVINKQQYLDIVDNSLREWVVDEGLFFDDKKLAFEVSPDDVGDIPKEARQAITDELVKRNKKVTEEAIREWYLVGIRKGAK